MKRAMTLVELLVCLVILAGLMASVVASTGGLRDSAAARRTAERGEAMKEALEAYEGLSAVSDMGGFVSAGYSDDENLARLGFLFRQFVHDAETGADGEAETLSTTKTADGWTELAPTWIPAALAASGASLASGSSVTSNRLETIKSRYETAEGRLSGAERKTFKIGCGWRGPYSATAAMDGEGRLLDGWGRPWRVRSADGEIALTSLGRDGATNDLEAAAAPWQDRDETFYAKLASPSLRVEIGPATAAAIGETPAFVHALVFSPRMKTPAADGRISFEAETRAYSSRRSETSVECADGLTAGTRGIFVFAEKTDGEIWYAPPRKTVLRPGANLLSVELYEHFH